MIKERLYQAVLIDGSSSNELYNTRQDALRAHRGNILKLVEVLPRNNKKTAQITPATNEVLLITKRNDDDLETSLSCGYTVTYNCPKTERLFEGMQYLEASDDQVLEAQVVRIERYEKSIHNHWKGPGYKEDKEWSWVIFHKNGKIIDKRVAKEKYDNTLRGTQGGIAYIKI